jgi:hypothetical protein
MQAVRQAGADPQVAQQETAHFIAAILAEARSRALAGDRASALARLGEAAHPVRDSSSGVHIDAEGNPK